MSDKINKSGFKLKNAPSIISFASAVGKKEGDGPLGKSFDVVVEDDYFGQETWEKAESKFLLTALETALKKGRLDSENLDVIFAGDLLNQCISTTYALRGLDTSVVGIYGACSTFALGLTLASIFCDNNLSGTAAAVTSSHFSTAERQFRFPLSYGGQRTPTSQWTVTGAGAAIVSAEGPPPYIKGALIGKINDLGVTDANNMGAAMAPAAADTIKRYLNDTGSVPSDYDCIVTGDLGTVGSELLAELLAKDGIDIHRQHKDCGVMIYNIDSQDAHAGGSGCGCSASVMCAKFLNDVKNGKIRNMLFAATGALMSPTASQQGESIPGISHLVHISSEGRAEK